MVKYPRYTAKELHEIIGYYTEINDIRKHVKFVKKRRKKTDKNRIHRYYAIIESRQKLYDILEEVGYTTEIDRVVKYLIEFDKGFKYLLEIE